MGFGRNPHVARAEAAELKAHGAKDSLAGKQGWLEAARQWERAAEREADLKRKQLHVARAEAARQRAEAGDEVDAQQLEDDELAADGAEGAETEAAPDPAQEPAAKPRTWLN